MSAIVKSSWRARMRPDDVIEGLARAQHGLVTRAQLLGAGVGAGAVQRRVHAGRLRAVHAGVYLVGPVESHLARELAAVLACGGASHGAAVSHWSAACLHNIARPRRARPIDITVRHGASHHRSGITVHACRTLLAPEVTIVQGVPVTTVARTLLDLAATTEPGNLERMVAQAQRDGKTGPEALRATAARHPRHRGVRNLAEVAGRDGGAQLTRSEAEKRLLELIRKARLPAPVTNTRVRGHEVDFFWRAHRLIIEVDGFAFHSSRDAFERDRHRDAALVAAGFRVIRLTWQQITTEPELMLVTVAQALFQRGTGTGSTERQRRGSGGAGRVGLA